MDIKIEFMGRVFNRPDYDNAYYYRKMTLNAIRNGQIIKKPCETCGNINSNAHHEVYSDYLNVIWLCKSCHSKIHGLLRGIEGRQKEQDRVTALRLERSKKI